jgi:hypothetical protein
VQVFKHTFDVVHDYGCYALMAIGAIALSVRFLTFGNGEITCVILGKYSRYLTTYNSYRIESKDKLLKQVFCTD